MNSKGIFFQFEIVQTMNFHSVNSNYYWRILRKSKDTILCGILKKNYIEMKFKYKFKKYSKFFLLSIIRSSKNKCIKYHLKIYSNTSKKRLHDPFLLFFFFRIPLKNFCSKTFYHKQTREYISAYNFRHWLKINPHRHVRGCEIEINFPTRYTCK